MSQAGASNYAYRAIVFSLKNGITWDKCIVGKKLMSYRSVVISEHPPQDDESTCEWNGLHYHGIVEHAPQYRFDGDRVFNQFKLECCQWFKSEKCTHPVNFLAYMEIPPRKKVYTNCRNSESDLPLLEAQITEELLNEVTQRKAERINSKKEGSRDIMYLKDLITQSGVQSESELISLYHNDPIFENVFCKRTFSTNFKKAYMFAIQSTLDTPFRDLCVNFKDLKHECLSANRSVEIMEQWCDHQCIDKQQFISDILNVMDKCKRKLNTLVLKGEPNSGKTFIAKSIQKACIFYGEVSQGTAGYSFMWQDCINKRVIIINEPFFDICMIEQLKVILEGTGTFVHKKNTSDEYLRPTPVIITTNNDIWSHCLSAETAIRARCLRIYDNLKPCDFLKRIKKDLNPLWMSIFAIRYARAASPQSDLSEDECHTGQVTGTVDQELTWRNPTLQEAPSTSSTTAADNTTSNSDLPVATPKSRPIKDLSLAPKKKVRSDKPLREQSKEKENSQESLDLSPYSLDPRRILSPQSSPGGGLTTHLAAAEEEYRITLNPKRLFQEEEEETPKCHKKPARWTQRTEEELNKLLEEEMEVLEEEDKSPHRC